MALINALEIYQTEAERISFQIGGFDADTFAEPWREPLYSVIWVQEGEGILQTDFSERKICADKIIFFGPYQSFAIRSDKIRGLAFHFHSDFYCIFHNNDQIGCNGVLFHNIYDPHEIKIDNAARMFFETLFRMIRDEMAEIAYAQQNMLHAQMNMLLIQSIRLRARADAEFSEKAVPERQLPVLQKLKELIETHFREKHAPSDYADLLDITPKQLGKLTKQHFDKTPTELISERIMTEAKRELYLTDKAVKLIAYELGFHDEYHFSRYFKSKAQVSPQAYRDSVGYHVMEK